ncbi:hypothetical protein SADUNF_Sadunf06G0072900 [Salix dunnii]|uniref:Sphingomyelin synthase-like domain-containing protein n=1 Tax=Salix dunnii TaxID=1413687 RepID=A0A835MWK0_9ROSI|nr:hypothetical protein SADUNF_Sadunf06G0072900 [Salix dunnii]
MSLYIGREASKLWKRICAETTTEINLLADNWKYILGGLIFQYIHGLAARGVHYLHRPGPILQDVGFFLLPELGQDKAYISETLFTSVFLSFIANAVTVLSCTLEKAFALIGGEVVLISEVYSNHILMVKKSLHLIVWTFHPFILKSKKIYTVLVWCRVLAFLVASQFLRIITFYSTQLPGPNYHCREGSKLARLPHPQSLFEVLLINFPRGITHGCGDLIFSSHMIFTLVFVLTYQKYGTKRCIKQLGWLIAVVLSFLIIASRKHYTVDVVVAWYTVNLVVFFLDKKLPDKDSKTREENHKLLNGNSLDPADWRQRTQVNGKILDDANLVHADVTAMNGA